MSGLQRKYDTRITQEEQVIFEIQELADEIFNETQSSLEELSFSISQSQDSKLVPNLELDHEKQVNQITKRMIKPKAKDTYLKKYQSPYSQKMVKTSRSFNKFKEKQTNHVYEVLTKRSKQKQQFEAFKSKTKRNNQYKWVTSRYKDQKSIMDNLAVEHNIIKAEAKLIHKIKVKNQSQSNHQLQRKWNSFLDKEKAFLENKKMQLVHKNHQKIMEEKSRRKPKDPTPDRPKMTVENLIKKLKRDTLKLKEKLIQTTNYFKYKQPSKSITKRNVTLQEIQLSKLDEQNQILVKDTQIKQQIEQSAQRKNNFFINDQNNERSESKNKQFNQRKQQRQQKSLKNGDKRVQMDNRERERQKKNIALRSVQQITFLISSRNRARTYQQ